MPSMRVTALAEFFFPSPKHKKAKRTSRMHLPAVNISRNHVSNIYPSVCMSASPTARGYWHRRYLAHHYHPCGADEDGTMSSDGEENQAPCYGSWLPDRSDTPVHAAGDAWQNRAVPAALPRPARTPTRSPTSGHRTSSGRAVGHLDCQDAPRFSLHANHMRQAPTCFVGTTPMSASDPSFYDQMITFRVIDQTRGHRENVVAPPDRHMIVLSSPANVPSVVDTLAPQGSGKRAVFQARSPQGTVQQGDFQFLVDILCRGWPFDVVIELE